MSSDLRAAPSLTTAATVQGESNSHQTCPHIRSSGMTHWCALAAEPSAVERAARAAERQAAHRLLVQSAAEVLSLRTWSEPMNAVESHWHDEAIRRTAIAISDRADALRARAEGGT